MMVLKAIPLKEPVELTSRICHFCKLEGRFTPVNSRAVSEGRYVIVVYYKGSAYVTEVEGVCSPHRDKFRHLLGQTIRR
ncbi:MAG: hypothetical protein WD970_00035 [Patescibacteria group bacterium]